MSPKEINNIKLKEADTNIEKRILGIIDDEVERIDYGKIILEITVSASKIKNIKVVEKSKSYQFD